MDQVEQIKEKTDIVGLISEYITLKKAGRNFKSPCPFHTEKSPSFVVSPERQMWHCFGCGKGGDAFSFLMEYERMEFPEALRVLAVKAGITLVQQSHTGSMVSQKERLYQCNSLAKEYYHYVLTKHAVGVKAREYLEKRGITQKVINTFSLGFSPNSTTALVQYLTQKKGFTKEEVVSAGLAFQGKYDVIDFFRGRLMFPLIDHRDNVVGFSGRVLEGDAPSKYINTRETLIYHKGEHFYGLSVTKDAIRRTNQAIIVEGEFDVISCFENGVGNVVGVKGTALTESQVTLLARFAQKITFCFDGDKAGQEAIKRSLSVVEKKNITPTVIDIPGGKDPDEALKTEPGLFKKAVSEDKGAYDYLLDQMFQARDADTVEGKKRISDTLLPFLGNIKNEIIKEHYLRKLSSKLDTSYESIQKELERLHTAVATKPSVVASPKVKRSKEEVLEEYLFSLIIQHDTPVHHAHNIVAHLSDVFTQERAYQKLLLQVSSYDDNVPFSPVQFAKSLPKELLSSYDTSLLFPLPAFSDDKKFENELASVTKKLRQMYIQKRLKEIVTELQEKGENEENEVVIALKKEYSVLTGKIESV